MYVHVNVHVYVYVHVYTRQARTHVSIYICTYQCTYRYAHTVIYIYMYCIYVDNFSRPGRCACVYVCVCVSTSCGAALQRFGKSWRKLDIYCSGVHWSQLLEPESALNFKGWTSQYC